MLKSLEKLKNGINIKLDISPDEITNETYREIADEIQAEIDEKYVPKTIAPANRISEDGDELWPMYRWICGVCNETFWDQGELTFKHCPHCGSPLSPVDSQPMINDAVLELIPGQLDKKAKEKLCDGIFAILARQRKLDGVE